MNQPLARAEAGMSSSMQFTALAIGDQLALEGDSGFIGTTTLTVERRSTSGWTEVGRAEWIGGPDSGALRRLVLR